MKPAAFDYVAARSLEEALAALSDGGEDAKPIAGGQSLVPALNMRLVRPTLLVDLNRAGLDGIEATAPCPDRGHGAPGRGSSTTRASTRCCARRFPSSATSSHATAARSAAASPTPTGRPRSRSALRPLGGTIVADGPAGRREIAPDEFFVTHYLTTLAPGELLVETVWPLPCRERGRRVRGARPACGRLRARDGGGRRFADGREPPSRRASSWVP